MAAIGKVTEWLQERLGVEGISLNRRKSQALLADGVGPEQLTEEQREAMDTTGLTVVRQGMRVVGVPVGTEQFQRDFLQEAVNGEPAELVRALVPMEDAQASFQILRLSATSRLSHLLRTVPPSITCQAAANYDALVEWALASMIAGDGAAAAGLPTPEEVAHDPTVCQNQTYLGHDALRQAHLPIREGGLGLTSSSSIKGAAYIGCHALVLGRVVAAPARGNLPSLLERLPERPMASALLEELKIVATEAKRSQIEDAVGSSWAALAAEEDPQGRGIGTLLVEAGAGGGGGGERGRGCWTARTIGGPVGNPVRWGDGAEPDQPRGRRSVRGSCTSRPIKALARPPRTPWEEAPARSPNLGKCPNEKSFGKVQGSAGEGRHGICGVPGGFARRHDGGPPVEGNLRQEPGVA